MSEGPREVRVEVKPTPVYLDERFFDDLPLEQGSDATRDVLGIQLHNVILKKEKDLERTGTLVGFLLKAVDNKMEEMKPEAAFREPQYWEANRLHFEAEAEQLGLTADMNALLEKLPDPKNDIPEPFFEVVKEAVKEL